MLHVSLAAAVSLFASFLPRDLSDRHPYSDANAAEYWSRMPNTGAGS